MKTPKKVTRVEPVVTPGGSDETVVDEDGDGATTAIAMTELHDEDIASQKQMIADMKAQRDAAQASTLEDAMDEDRVKDEDDESSDEEGESPKETAQPLKRSREDEELKFEFKEPKAESEVTERAIVTNRRVSGFRLEPQQKSFAWGMAAFAVGFGAVYVPFLVPTLRRIMTPNPTALSSPISSRIPPHSMLLARPRICHTHVFRTFYPFVLRLR